MNKKNIWALILGSLSVFVSVSLITVMSLTATGAISLLKSYHEVEFRNYDGTYLFTDNVEEGETAVYEGPIPERPRDDYGTYIFTGWDENLENVSTSFYTKAVFSKQSIGIGEEGNIELGDQNDGQGSGGEGSGAEGDGNGNDGSGEGSGGDGGSGGGGGGSGEELKGRPLMVSDTDYKGRVYIRKINYGDYKFNRWTYAPQFPMDKLGDSGITSLSYTPEISFSKYPSYSIGLKYLTEFDYFPVPNYNMDFKVRSSNDSFGLENFTEEEYKSRMICFKGNQNDIEKISSDGLTKQQRKERDEYYNFAYKNYTYQSNDYINCSKNIIKTHNLENIGTDYYKVKDALLSEIQFNPKKTEYTEFEDSLLHAYEDTRIGDNMILTSWATLVYRALGIPARFVSGYLYDSIYCKNPHVVSTGEIYYWVEIYDRNIGWVSIDITNFDKDEPYNPDDSGGSGGSGGDIGGSGGSGDDSGGSGGDIGGSGGSGGDIGGSGGSGDSGSEGEIESDYDGNLSINIASEEKIYDGKVYIPKVSYRLSKLRKGDQVLLDFPDMKKIINVGKYNIMIKYRIVDSEGDDASSYYNVKLTKNAHLTILPRKITLQTASFTAHYFDGINGGYEKEKIVEGTLAQYEVLTINYDNFECPGEYQNYINYKNVFIESLYNIDGVDSNRTSNYEITFKYGTVTIL